MTGIGFHMIDWEIPKKVEEAEFILNMLMTFDVCQQLCVNQTYAIDIPTGETVYPVTYGPNGTNTTHNATAGMLHQTVPCLGIEFFPKWASALWNATSRTYDIHITALSDGPMNADHAELIVEIGTCGYYYVKGTPEAFVLNANETTVPCSFDKNLFQEDMCWEPIEDGNMYSTGSYFLAGSPGTGTFQPGPWEYALGNETLYDAHGNATGNFSDVIEFEAGAEIEILQDEVYVLGWNFKPGHGVSRDSFLQFSNGTCSPGSDGRIELFDTDITPTSPGPGYIVLEKPGVNACVAPAPRTPASSSDPELCVAPPIWGNSQRGDATTPTWCADPPWCAAKFSTRRTLAPCRTLTRPCAHSTQVKVDNTSRLPNDANHLGIAYITAPLSGKFRPEHQVPQKINREYTGCTDPDAINYNPYAFVDVAVEDCKYNCTFTWTPTNYNVQYAAAKASVSSFLPTAAGAASRGIMSAFDNDMTTSYHSNQGSPSKDNPVVIEYDFIELAPHEAIVQYSMSTRCCDSPLAGGDAPKSWTVHGSNDGATWDTIDTVEGESGWESVSVSSLLPLLLPQ